MGSQYSFFFFRSVFWILLSLDETNFAFELLFLLLGFLFLFIRSIAFLNFLNLDSFFGGFGD